MAQTNQSFAKRIVAAILANDRASANTLTQSALQSIGEEIVKIIENHPTSDLPLVIASMRIIAASFEGILSNSGQLMVNHLVNMTESIVIPKSQFMAQFHQEEAANE